MSWKRGTDLRNKEGIYQWPPVGVVGSATPTRLYPSVTSIIDALDGSDMAFVHGTYIAKHVSDLVEIAKQKGMTERWRQINTPEGKKWALTDAYAKDVLTDVDHVRYAGFRQLRKDADRGSVIHELISQWCSGSGIDFGELQDWLEHTVIEERHSCSVEDVLPYAISALHWLEKVQPRCIHVDSPVFHDGRKGECGAGQGLYAGTLDFVGAIGDRLFILDFKTSKASRRAHGMQLAAYKHARYIGIKGTDKRVPMIRVDGVASVLIQPDTVTFREWSSTTDWFKAFRHAIHAFRRLRGNMNVSTLHRYTTHTPQPKPILEVVSA